MSGNPLAVLARMYGRGLKFWFFSALAMLCMAIFVMAGMAVIRLFINIPHGSDLEMYLMMGLFLAPVVIVYAWDRYC